MKEKVKISDLSKDQLAVLAQEMLKEQEKAARLHQAKQKQKEKARKQLLAQKVKAKAEKAKQKIEAAKEKKAEKERLAKAELKDLVNSDVGQFVRMCKEISKQDKGLTFTVQCEFNLNQISNIVLASKSKYSYYNGRTTTRKVVDPIEAISENFVFIPADAVELLAKDEREIKMVVDQYQELIKKYGASKLNSIMNKVYSKIKV